MLDNLLAGNNVKSTKRQVRLLPGRIDYIDTIFRTGKRSVGVPGFDAYNFTALIFCELKKLAGTATEIEDFRAWFQRVYQMCSAVACFPH